MAEWSDKQRRGFSDAAQSLKLYRRAELIAKNDQPIIEALYVDPLPEDGVFTTMMRPNTTYLIGRKGTGKSTIFQRTQHQIRKSQNSLSAYIDIKTVYESAEVDQSLLAKIREDFSGLPDFDVRRLLLYRSFIRSIFSEIKSELKKHIESSILTRLKEAFSGDRAALFESLDDLFDASMKGETLDVSGVRAVAAKTSGSEKKVNSNKQSTGVDVGADLSLTGWSAKGSLKGAEERYRQSEQSDSSESAYSAILLRTFNIASVISELEEILGDVGIKRLFIFIDDFSELPEGAMEIFVDTVLSPLNNLSNELIKFKVAAYPGRIYFGNIDRTKVEEIYLDLYKLYGSNDVSSMEDKAIEFTARLINSRIKYYCGKMTLEDFSETDIAAVSRNMFYATMGNPRNVGHVLNYLYDSHVVYNKRIGLRAIQDAAAKYYHEKIEPFFGRQKFLHTSFSERSSTFSLKELLENVVDRSKELRTYQGSAVTRDLSGRTPSSHFYVATELESLLSTLELNFFLTKYFEQKDRDGKLVAVFALNYGLCASNTISFGRPGGKREHRLYFIERIFDYTSILKKFLERNQEIKCEECGAIHELGKLDSLRMYGMMCPECRSGTCVVSNLSRRYEEVLRSIGDELLLPETELGILEALFSEDRALAPMEIAGELDCSYQLVGKRGVIMEERGLIDRPKTNNRRRFHLTPKAIDDYFASNSDRRLETDT